MEPFLDLKKQYQSIQKEIDSSVKRVLASGWFILGPEGELFEKEFAAWLNVKHAIGVSSATDALAIALRAVGVGYGHEVLIPANTAIPTAVAVTQVGARPIFCDIDQRTYTLNPEEIQRRITQRTKAIIPVHLYGHAASMDPIMAYAKRYQLAVIEDCAQAQGTTYHGKKVGTMGDLGCFSFYPSKNLGCYGDGGLITTNNDILKDRVTRLRNYGIHDRYHVHTPGWNARLDEIQAAILRTKLKHLDKWNKKRQQLARLYTNSLQKSVMTPQEMQNTTHVYHLYVIRTQQREQLRAFLQKKGIATEIHYPIPLHHQSAFKHAVTLPIAETVTKEILSLPLYPELSISHIKKIIRLILEWKKNNTK